VILRAGNGSLNLGIETLPPTLSTGDSSLNVGVEVLLFTLSSRDGSLIAGVEALPYTFSAEDGPLVLGPRKLSLVRDSSLGVDVEALPLTLSAEDGLLTVSVTVGMSMGGMEVGGTCDVGSLCDVPFVALSGCGVFNRGATNGIGPLGLALGPLEVGEHRDESSGTYCGPVGGGNRCVLRC
jgi:hypothetical protein